MYDELGRETERLIEGDIENTLRQENVLEVLENIIQEEQKKLNAREIIFRKKVIATRIFLLIAGVLGGAVAMALSMLPFNVFMAILLAPVVSFVLTGSTIALVSAISNRIEYKNDKEKTLQKIIYCQERKEMELKKLEEITKKKNRRMNSVKKETNLYYKDTIREIEREVRDGSVGIVVPKRRVRTKRSILPRS